MTNSSSTRSGRVSCSTSVHLDDFNQCLPSSGGPDGAEINGGALLGFCVLNPHPTGRRPGRGEPLKPHQAHSGGGTQDERKGCPEVDMSRVHFLQIFLMAVLSRVRCGLFCCVVGRQRIGLHTYTVYSTLDWFVEDLRCESQPASKVLPLQPRFLFWFL